MARLTRTLEVARGWRALRRAALWVSLLAGPGLAPSRCLAAEGQPLEYQVKAAFLLNFTKFIEWPRESADVESQPFSICIAGDDPFGRALDQIVEGETVNGRKLAIERLHHEPPKSCQILFIPKSERDSARIVSSAGPGVLTVGEGEGFLREGGAISFVIDNRRVRFDISRGAARNASLKISSKLLSVARSVEK